MDFNPHFKGSVKTHILLLCCYDLVLRCPHKDQDPNLVLPGWWLKLQEVGQLRSFQIWEHALEGKLASSTCLFFLSGYEEVSSFASAHPSYHAASPQTQQQKPWG